MRGSVLVLDTSSEHVLTSIKLAFIIDHKHDLPFEYIVVEQTAGNAGDIFIGLHLFELTGQ